MLENRYVFEAQDIEEYITDCAAEIEEQCTAYPPEWGVLPDVHIVFVIEKQEVITKGCQDKHDRH